MFEKSSDDLRYELLINNIDTPRKYVGGGGDKLEGWKETVTQTEF